MFGQFKIDPMFQLFLKQKIAEKEHRFEMLNNPSDVMNGIRRKRKEYLGSDLGLTMFVHEDGEPLEDVVKTLSQQLGDITTHFLEKDYNARNIEDYMNELCYGFFYYSLQLYAYNKVGDDSIDDLIRLAELFRSDIAIFNIVLEEDLPKEIVDEWMAFTARYDYIPYGFPEAVTGAVSVFLGVLK